MDKHPFVRDSLLRTGIFYSVSSLAYLWFVSSITNGSGDIGALAGLIAVKMLILLGFSAVFGFSYFIFGTGLMPTAKRTLHLCILMIAWVAAFMLLGSIGETAQSKIMTVLVALGIFLVAYPLGMLVHYLLRKKIK